MKLNPRNKPKKHMFAAAAAAFLVSGVSLYLVFSSFASTGVGVPYNWKTGVVQSNFNTVNTMPADWDFISFTSVMKDSTSSKFGLWLPIGTPEVGSRDLAIGDTGDDVLALQKTLNLVRSDDPNDEYYFDKVPETGTFDQTTFTAVYMLQGYFGSTATGDADLTFQSSLYQQAVTPSE